MKKWPRLTDHEYALVRYALQAGAGSIGVSVPSPIATIADALNSSREIISAALTLLNAGDVERARVILRGAAMTPERPVITVDDEVA